jgi:hypothetical protein
MQIWFAWLPHLYMSRDHKHYGYVLWLALGGINACFDESDSLRSPHCCRGCKMISWHYHEQPTLSRRWNMGAPIHIIILSATPMTFTSMSWTMGGAYTCRGIGTRSGVAEEGACTTRWSLRWSWGCQPWGGSGLTGAGLRSSVRGRHKWAPCGWVGG